MADPRKAASSAPAGDAGERLAELNDHLGRFLQHADQLLDEWTRFGTQVRAGVDAEIERIDEAVAAGVDRAADRASHALAARLDGKVAERVDQTLGEGVTRLRGELDRLARAAGGLVDTERGRRTEIARSTLIGVVAANILLVALIVLSARDCAAAQTPSAPMSATPADAGTTEIDHACATLIAGWSDDAAAVVLRAGTAACGVGAQVVAERFAERLAPPPIDAGGAPPDAGVPDAAPARPRKHR